MSADLTGARWVKSSYSQSGGECVEVAHFDDAVGVRDSKDVAGPVLVFEPSTWTAFTRAVRPAE